MAETGATRTWAMRGTYAALAATVLFAQLLPLDFTPRRIAPPDWIAALTFAWALRRPDFVPPWLVAAVLVLADLLMQRPPGLWAALVLVAAEYLRRRDRGLRDSTFLEEWLTVALVLGIISLIYRVILGLTIVSAGTFALALTQYGATVLAYPLVVGLSHLLFGVRHTAPGEYDPAGRAP